MRPYAASSPDFLIGFVFVAVEWVFQIIPAIQDTFTLFLGLIIEAFPFVVLGVGVSSLLAVFLKDEWIEKYIPKNRFLSHPMLALAGALVPVCQCGNIPIARRLLAKGFSVSEATTFMLAAPIVNPLTLFTTLQAFSMAPWIAGARVTLGFFIAVAIGLAISCIRDQKSLLKEKFIAEVCEPGHEHGRGMALGLEIFRQEFTEMMKMLFVGGAVAAIAQEAIPRTAIAALGAHPLYSILAMMALGFVISMCSNVDAFFALSYSQNFTLGSLMVFMLFGPTIDIKILSMLRSTFKPRALAGLGAAVGACAIVAGLGINLLYKPFL